MPVLRFKVDRLLEYSGFETIEEVREALFRLKCEAEEVESGVLEVEVNPDRPDMYISDGIVRVLRGLRGIEEGWQRPQSRNSGLRLSSTRPSTRPYIAAAVLYNVNVDEDYLEELIQFQEKLHDTIGRRRRKIAIGIHDLDKLPGRNIKYTMATLDTPIKPLGMDSYKTIRWVLENTEQGVKYGGISRSGGEHPVLVADGEPIAIPPVINSEVTRVEPGTRNLFIDVTGTDPALVFDVVDLMASTIAYRDNVVVGVLSFTNGEAVETPRLSTERVNISLDYVNKVLGTGLSASEASGLLRRMRYNALAIDEGSLEVEVPPFRLDIIREVDIVEDIAIAIGYEELEPRRPQKLMRGVLEDTTTLNRVLRSLLIGLGYTEVMQLTLTSPRYVDALGLSGEAVYVANPVQQEYSVLRPSLLVTLLPLLRGNMHREKPVRVFEIGWVVKRKGDTVEEDLRLAMGIMDDEVSYEDIQAPTYSILRILNVTFNVEPGKVNGFLEGRTGVIESGGEVLGWMGEVDPGVLEKLGLEYPVAAAELSINKLKSRIKSRS